MDSNFLSSSLNATEKVSFQLLSVKDLHYPFMSSCNAKIHQVKEASDARTQLYETIIYNPISNTSNQI